MIPPFGGDLSQFVTMGVSPSLETNNGRCCIIFCIAMWHGAKFTRLIRTELEWLKRDWVWHCRPFIIYIYPITSHYFATPIHEWNNRFLLRKFSWILHLIWSNQQLPDARPQLGAHAGRWQTKTTGTLCGDLVFQCVSHVNPLFVPLSCRSCIRSNSIYCTPVSLYTFQYTILYYI